MSSGVEIINASFALEALRESGFKSLANNIAELVDNSIEHGANKINIVGLFEAGVYGGVSTASYKIKEIAVFDDGTGIDETILQSCLQIGFTSSNKEDLKLGKYGYGLKGATINLGRRIELFTWKKDLTNCKYVFLDLDEISGQDAGRYLEHVSERKVPEKYIKFINKANSGTLVLIKKLDKISIKRPAGLIGSRGKNSSFVMDLSKIFRHFLDNDDTYGKKRDIKVWAVDFEDSEKNIIEPINLIPNDPMFLLTPNHIKVTARNDSPKELEAASLSGKATNELIEENTIAVDTHIGKSEYIIRLSMAYPCIQKLGGNVKVLELYQKNIGISFVRSEREIELGSFDYLDRSNPKHRWWGIEVRFKPDLDDYFKITHDKQTTLHANKMHPSEVRDLIEELDNKPKETWDKDDYITNFRIHLSDNLDRSIKKMMQQIDSRGVGTRTNLDGEIDDYVIPAVNSDIINEGGKGKSEFIAEKKTEKEKIEELKLIKKDEDSTRTDEEAEGLAKNSLSYKVDLAIGSWIGDVFLDKQHVGNGATGIINRRSNFFKTFYEYLNSQTDKKGVDALRILLMAYIRAEDELSNKYEESEFEDLRKEWGKYMELLVKHAE